MYNNCLPINTIYPKVNKILVIGDIHGDYNALVKCLMLGGIINDKKKWVGNDSYVIQLGDLLDSSGRGIVNYDQPEEKKIFKLLLSLRKQALKHNGEVILIMGNHELLNVKCNFDFVSQVDLVSFGGKKNRCKLFKPRGEWARLLGCNTRGIVKIGRWLFSHAGVTPQITKYTIEEVNKAIYDYLVYNKTLDPVIEEFLSHRLYYDCPTCEYLKEINKIYKVKGQFIGHNPVGIKTCCSGSLYYSDNMMSKAFNDLNDLAFFMIIDDKFIYAYNNNFFYKMG